MKGNEGRPAVFLDRDGTVNRQVGYLNHPSRLRIYPYAAEAIRRLNKRRIPVVILTNQSGVARGYYPEEVLVETNRLLIDRLADKGAHIDRVYYCPHHPTAGDKPRRCRCRKPGTGMVRKAERELGIDAGSSFVVGDGPGDIELAAKIGARSVLVLTGYGRGERDYCRSRWKAEPDHIAKNLSTAVDWILGHIDKRSS